MQEAALGRGLHDIVVAREFSRGISNIGLSGGGPYGFGSSAIYDGETRESR